LEFVFLILITFFLCELCALGGEKNYEEEGIFLCGMRGNSGQANYASAKAGVVGLSRALSKECGSLNVQVNAVSYGWIDTRLTQEKETGQTLERDGKAIAIGIPAAMRNIMPMLIPMGRAGSPEEAAGPLLFLASPLSGYLSGQCIEVTGGF
jgi:3-oxoacyl-[acyl-carrier protein] reductase